MANSKSSLSSERQEVLREMQSINFGCIECLAIRGGEPVLHPRPNIVREHKFGGENGPHPKLGRADFLLKQQVVELFGYFDELQDGVIDVLEVKHGLPFRMIVREAPA